VAFDEDKISLWLYDMKDPQEKMARQKKRLEQALRANLLRRKEQARKRLGQEEQAKDKTMAIESDDEQS